MACGQTTPAVFTSTGRTVLVTMEMNRASRPPTTAAGQVSYGFDLTYKTACTSITHFHWSNYDGGAAPERPDGPA